MSLCFVSDSWYHDANKAKLFPNNGIADSINRWYIRGVTLMIVKATRQQLNAGCQNDSCGTWANRIKGMLEFQSWAADQVPPWQVSCIIKSADQERMTKEQWAHDTPQIKNQDWGNCNQKIGWCVCIYAERKERSHYIYTTKRDEWRRNGEHGSTKRYAREKEKTNI